METLKHLNCPLCPLSHTLPTERIPVFLEVLDTPRFLPRWSSSGPLDNDLAAMFFSFYLFLPLVLASWTFTNYPSMLAQPSCSELPLFFFFHRQVSQPFAGGDSIHRFWRPFCLFSKHHRDRILSPAWLERTFQFLLSTPLEQNAAYNDRNHPAHFSLRVPWQQAAWMLSRLFVLLSSFPPFLMF